MTTPILIIIYNYTIISNYFYDSQKWKSKHLKIKLNLQDTRL